jgi:hypothetical protein
MGQQFEPIVTVSDAYGPKAVYQHLMCSCLREAAVARRQMSIVRRGQPRGDPDSPLAVGIGSIGPHANAIVRRATNRAARPLVDHQDRNRLAFLQ